MRPGSIDIKDSMKVFGMILISLGVIWFGSAIMLLGFKKITWWPAGTLFIIGSIFIIAVGFIAIKIVHEPTKTAIGRKLL